MHGTNHILRSRGICPRPKKQTHKTQRQCGNKNTRDVDLETKDHNLSSHNTARSGVVFSALYSQITAKMLSSQLRRKSVHCAWSHLNNPHRAPISRGSLSVVETITKHNMLRNEQRPTHDDDVSCSSRVLFSPLELDGRRSLASHTPPIGMRFALNRVRPDIGEFLTSACIFLAVSMSIQIPEVLYTMSPSTDDS